MSFAFFLICGAAALAALLTLFSGFGLGTLLTPVFALFFEAEVAVALTGVVHLANNLFKLALLGRAARWDVVARFGIPSVLGAFCGAYLLGKLAQTSAWAYQIGNYMGQTTALKVSMALLILFFVAMDVVPVLKNLSFPRSSLLPGGLVSGFFGGLSGHQGALRSAFLIRLGMSKETFVATGVTIACLVDATRLPVYFSGSSRSAFLEQWPLLLGVTLSAFVGVFVGTRLLEKITIGAVQVAVSAMLSVIAVLLGLGII
jgi:uncharacterized membrane protein YfcA